MLSRETHRKAAKAEKARLRYASIKENPAQYELMKMKQKEKYLKRKEDGKVKSVADMSEEEKEKQRKSVRERVSACRSRKKVSIRDDNETPSHHASSQDQDQSIPMAGSELVEGIMSSCDAGGTSSNPWDFNFEEDIPVVFLPSEDSYFVDSTTSCPSSSLHNSPDFLPAVDLDCDQQVPSGSIQDSTLNGKKTNNQDQHSVEGVSVYVEECPGPSNIEEEFFSNVIEINDIPISTLMTSDDESLSVDTFPPLFLGNGPKGSSEANKNEINILSVSSEPIMDPSYKNRPSKSHKVKNNNQRTCNLSNKTKPKRHNLRNCHVQDCDLCVKQREIDSSRYLRRREEGKIPNISRMNNKQKAQFQKKNRMNVQKHRQSKNTSNNLTVNVPEISIENSSTVSNKKKGLSRQKLQAQKRKKSENYLEKLRKEIKILKRENKILKRGKERYRKRAERTTNTAGSQNSPRKKVKKFLKGRCIPNDVKQKLLEGEVLQHQLQTGYSKLKGYKDKRIYSSVISGNILRKYKMLQAFKGIMLSSRSKSFKRNKSIKDLKLPHWRAKRTKRLAEIVKDFLETDKNSKVAPGKKETMTKGKVKKQRRYLNKPLYELYEDFKITHGKDLMSKSTFYKLKPFWILSPRVTGRDTCLCTRHENINLLVQKLNSLGLVSFKSESQLVKFLCCENYSDDCFLRKCPKCKDKQVEFGPHEEETPTYYFKWVSKTEERISVKTKGLITVKIQKKEKIECTAGQLIQLLQNDLPGFLNHCLQISHQYCHITQKKKSLGDHEIVLHVDFAENWNCKYKSEIQAVHYGASRNQISLHTGMIYAPGGIKQGFCSASESLRHDPVAIFAHLHPVLEKYLNKYPEVTAVHFVSDGPSTQYKNKTMFGLLATTIPEHFPQIKLITWNFCAAGHGKGAHDGIGAGVKRKADNIVAHNKDIPDFQRFSELLCKKYKSHEEETENEEDKRDKLQMFIIKDIDTYDTVCFKHSKSVAGHKEIHQVTWNRESPKALFYNRLSCFLCTPGSKCVHYFHASQLIHEEEEQTGVENDNPKATTDLENAKTHIDREMKNLSVGEWVAVLYEDGWYPGVVVKLTKLYVTVKFMERAGNNTFKWPSKEEVLRIKKVSLICRIPEEPTEISASLFTLPASAELDRLVSTNM